MSNSTESVTFEQALERLEAVVRDLESGETGLDRSLERYEEGVQLLKRCRAIREGCTDEDVIATATALTVRSIEDAYRRFMPEPVDEVLVSGGGSKNAALMDMLRSALAPMRVRRFDEVFFDGEAKEAVAFALLAKLFIEGRPGNVPSATGALGPRILGKLTPGKLKAVG